jgi:CO dehydrogenase/acetyl-CoA synthase epsilon subunit
MSKEFDDFMDSVKQLSEESWEGCDGCTKQDEIMYKNGYVKGYNSAIVKITKEISDEEIEKFADEEFGTIRTDFDFGIIQGMKWYREQLKKL